jgi:hypothetical protein
MAMTNFAQCDASCLAQIVLFERGRVLVHTKDILASALRDAGLPLMALKAAEGYYHDYLSPLAMPEKQLVSELTIIGTPAALALCERVKNGDYGASEEEEEAWVSSPDGVAAMQALAAKSNKKHA